ncbi:MAG TPA: oxygen-independent coproporphyrinogen III oxidase [Bacteroidia bacterium]|jgi:oxygen-independent coproporphyrinogen-3 oxidase|nr:oxygen-independent coproporphyrinogen III oxidase [Bacteroidia bacterium]
MVSKDLIARYDVAVPRYTSYPSVPHWDRETPAAEIWKKNVMDAWTKGGKDLNLYIHLPFCESLCTYCACNTRITKNHSVEEPYIKDVLKEWAMYTDIFGEDPRITELHLGGGTPTFFKAENLAALVGGIASGSVLAKNAVLSFEAHPANTTSGHLEMLYANGFRRISIGIQDFDPKVQRLIHRRQSEEQVKAITNLARIIGFTSINFDLIYGLPSQTIGSITETINKVIAIRPDRIAFYSYAHVPWVKPGQRAYSEKDLPTGETKRELYETGRAMLEAAGYTEIGLDHFALAGDELLTAVYTGKLHRNFMGYTTGNSPLLIGLGVSAISDTGTMLVQNEKTVEQWAQRVHLGELPFFRGHQLNRSDLILRKHILNIMCTGESSWLKPSEQVSSMEKIIGRLKPLADDGLVNLTDFSVSATKTGRRFLRNIGACFDEKLHRSTGNEPLFSQTA